MHKQKIVDKGTIPIARHKPNNTFEVLFVDNGQLMSITSYPELGQWENLEFSEPEQKAPDSNINTLNIYYYPGTRTWIAWSTEDEPNMHRYVVDPDEEPEIEHTPYKLYYAYDTDMLYMNIEEFWYFIASLRHDLLMGLNLDVHPQYQTEGRHWESHRGQTGDELPEASEEYRGLFFLKQTDDADELYVCMKTSDDTYEWKLVQEG